MFSIENGGELLYMFENFRFERSKVNFYFGV